ncbi:hypothetical protein KKF34_06985 [Myxococcota bacterium]|nr:hypothetical protein [Myxococcota bacterium]MBU1382947.1 hypothetical protein [Myxococcota bacterium]MBU1496606.1 hypothetical protein [Myxococcota bacterium]
MFLTVLNIRCQHPERARTKPSSKETTEPEPATRFQHIHRFSAKNGVSEGIKDASGIADPWWALG